MRVSKGGQFAILRGAVSEWVATRYGKQAILAVSRDLCEIGEGKMISTDPENQSDVMAHVKQNKDKTWAIHPLGEHLLTTGNLAGSFASEFGSSDWGRIAGLWHDLGKYSQEFQNYIMTASGFNPEAHIENSPGKVDHSTAGALQAIRSFDKAGRILAYIAAGHHAGLPDWNSSETGNSSLVVRLEKKSLLDRVLSQPQLPQDILNEPKPSSMALGGKEGFSLWIRMLFSCLVDADFLDTEAFMDKEKSNSRKGAPQIDEMLPVFNRYMEEKIAKATETPVNTLRSGVLNQCRQKAALPPGIFSLTVPTGGGKTLSSLAFALEHAIAHKKRRIVYAVPYTSIIEQTSETYREIFRSFSNAVIEHHSNLDPDKETPESRLATENWDAPLIVTTNVQLFESLFSSKTSRCRKLHNLVNSIVILDEVQLLPPEFLQPILDAINLLARCYRITFVLSTATQPALNTVKNGFGHITRRGIDGVREIIDDVDSLYSALNRVEVVLPSDLTVRSNWDDLAEEICRYDSVLAIVNTRNDCRELWQRMPKGTIHLSGLMCGEHRSNVIKSIKERLNQGIPTCVISTQLVESGVDLDFPVVFRAIAGLDSVAQAAGRCNREGKLKNGRVVVFTPPKISPKGLLRFGEDATRELLSDRPSEPLARDQFEKYFNLFLNKAVLDKYKINELLTPSGELDVQFRTASEKFQLIDGRETQAVLVNYQDKGIKLIEQLGSPGPNRDLMRKLQRYTVTLYRHDLNRLLVNGDIKEIATVPGVYSQVGDTLYDPQVGLLLSDTATLDPASLLV